jgi:hypothetical protein
LILKIKSLISSYWITIKIVKVKKSNSQEFQKNNKLKAPKIKYEKVKDKKR